MDENNTKCINFNDENIYSELFIRIIKKIEKKENFQIGYYRIMKTENEKVDSATGAKFVLNAEKLSYYISIVEFNKELYLNNEGSKIREIYKYFNSLDIIEEDLIALASYVFIILHELGHVYYYNKHKTKLKKMKIFSDTIKNANLLFHDIIDSEDAHNQFYIELQSEANADIFAYKNFYFLWKEMKLNNFYKGII